MNQNLSTFIEFLLIDGRVRLSEIPTDIRVSDTAIYISAFRVSRNISKERYLQDLNILENDLSFVDNNHFTEFQNLLSNYKYNIKFITGN